MGERVIRRLRLTPCPWLRRPPIELAVTGWFARWMRRRGWGGVTLPTPFGVLVMYWLEIGDGPAGPVRLHEMTHAAQAQTFGWWRWWLRYVVLWIWQGYDVHEMEREARQQVDLARLGKEWPTWL
jgi:hypothetical protein